MHFWRNIFSSKFPQENRLIGLILTGPAGGPNPGGSAGSGRGGPETGPGGDDKNKNGEKVPEHLAIVKQRELRKQIQEEAEAKSREGQRRLREQVEDVQGEPKEYIETFKGSADFDILAANLETGMEIDNESLWNFEKWPTIDPPSVIADFFTQCGFFPHGKGRGAFLEGLRLPVPENGDETPNAKKFRESHRVLREIVTVLRKHFEMKRGAKEDVQKQLDKHPLGETIGDGLRSLMHNFRRADGVGKGMILGAIGIALILLNKYKDKKIFKNGETTYMDVMWWIGAGLGLNYLSGKVTKDGRTIAQKLDFGRELDDLQNGTLLKGYAAEHGMGKDQEKLRAYLRLQTTDARKIFELYKEAGGPTATKREIDPRRLGIEEDQIDGKATYDIIHELVKRTSVNERMRVREEEAARRGVKFAGPSGPERSEWESPGRAMATFEAKYVYGDLGKVKQSLFDVIVNEYRTSNYALALARDEASLIPHRVAEGVVGAAGVIGSAGLEAGKTAAKWVGRGAVAGYEWTRDEVAVPLGSWVKGKWKKWAPRAHQGLKDAIRWQSIVEANQQRTLNKVLPTDFKVDVTADGKATIMGLPNIAFESKTRSDGKDVVIIKGVEFVLDDGVSGNSRLATQLATSIQNDVEAMLGTHAGASPILAGKKPVWIHQKNSWEVKNVTVTGDTLLGIAAGTTDLRLTVHPDGSKLHLFAGEKEINNLSAINTVYRDSIIQKKVWDADPRVAARLKGLDVEVTKVSPHPTYGALIEGKIGGLAFKAVLKPGRGINDGLQFFDGTNAGGAEKVQITASNGGPEFLDAQAAQILGSPQYIGTFKKLEALVDNMSEGILDRILGAFPTTRLWIIPTSLNLPAAINGKILHRQWKYTLDYKQTETIEFFQAELQRPGATLADVQTAYHRHIDSALQHIEELSRSIQSTPEEERPKRFVEYLSGDGVPGSVPAGLENVGYTNPGYKALYKEFKAVITDPGFNYAGLESLSDVSVSAGDAKWGAADEAFEINQILHRVWSYHTRQYAVEDPAAANPTMELHPDTERAIRNGVTERIRGHLQIAMSVGGGAIHIKDLPPHETDADLEAWVDPAWARGSARPAQGARWGVSGAITAYRSREAAGLEPITSTAERRELEGSIKPTPEGLKAIRDQLKKIVTDVYPTRYASIYAGKFSMQYNRILKDIPDALMYQAITENGSEKALLDRFRSQIEHIKDKSTSDSFGREVVNVMVAFFKWIVESKTWNLTGENPNIQDKLIKPRHKKGLAEQMDKIEKYYQERNEDVHGHWYGDAYDSDKVDFFVKTEIPFYREFYMNKSIMENRNAMYLANEYSEFLKSSFKECLKKPADKKAQEIADRAETAARSRDPKWTGPVLEMEKHIRT